MQGANEYAAMFQTGQHGRLYLLSSSHARGPTFHIYVLPSGVSATPNGPNAPLNSDAVEVYGVTGGQRGWTETYGWLHEGRWQDDFEKLVEARKAELAVNNAARELREREKAELDVARRKALLATY